MEEIKIKSRVVGVDISNERTTYAIIDIRGNIIAEDSFPTEEFADINDFVKALSEKIVMLVESNGGYETIRSIGVSAPSASSVSGCIENAANLPWKGVIPLAVMLRWLWAFLMMPISLRLVNKPMEVPTACATLSSSVWVWGSAVASSQKASSIRDSSAMPESSAIPVLTIMAVSVAVATEVVLRPMSVQKVSFIRRVNSCRIQISPH